MKWLIPTVFALSLAAQDKQDDTSLLYCCRCIGKGKGNFHVYHRISEKSVKVKEGDKFRYDIFLPSDQPELKGGIDIQFTDGSTLRDSGIVDQNKLSAHGDSALDQAKARWYTRTFDLSPLAGRVTSVFDIQCEADTPGVYVQILDNVVIESKDGWKTSIYENGKPEVDDLHWREGYSKEAELATLPRGAVKEGPELKKLVDKELARTQLRTMAKNHKKQLDVMADLLKKEGKEELLKDIDEAKSKIPDPESFEGTPDAYLDALHRSCHKLSHAHPKMAEYTGHLVGHAHIDFSWLWDWNEGIEVTRQTFVQAAKFMADYPEFKFSQSSGALYFAMEEHHPDVFREVQKYVKKGQWELVGGRWSEGDTNMVTEEGHARQFLLGQRYFREKFGVDCKVGWEPDTFGHTWQMPQLLKLAGIENYYFCRAGKGKCLFMWEAPDGTQVLAFDEPALGTGSWYNGDVTEKNFKEISKFNEKYGSKDMLWVYGVGNHGGGPTLENIKTALEWQKSPYLPRAKFSTATEFFAKLREQKLKNVETIRGELNAVFEGCYTTHSRVKKDNRDGEYAAVRSEAAATIASKFGFGYPRKGFWETWKDICWNHHHDTLPGSSIHKSYELSHRLYQQGIDRSTTTMNEAMDFLVDQMAAPERGGLMVFNPLGWKRDAIVTAPMIEGLPQGQLSAVAPNGDRSPVQRTDEGELVFVARDLPSFGYRVYRIEEAVEKSAAVACRNDGASISNGRYDLEIDPATGCVVKLFDKKLNKELAAKPLNDLVIHWEGPHGMAAWEIGPITRVERPGAAPKIEVVENGPVRCRVRVRRGYDVSGWAQDVIVYRDLDLIEFRLDVEWKQKGAARTGSPFLRTLFPLEVPGAKARYAIPFGDIERPQPAKGDIAAPKGSGPDSKDVAALTWADVGNDEFGVALLNDCKHGYQSQGGTLRLSLLRASWEPDPIPDVGQHLMRYALVPHPGSIHDASIPRRGIEFNAAPAVRWIPRVAPPGGKPAGWNMPRAKLGNDVSFLSFSAKSVVPTSLKLSEDGAEWIVRYYESSGQKTETAITCVVPIAKAELVNLIEDRLGDADPAKLTLRGYEIQTLKLKLK